MDSDIYKWLEAAAWEYGRQPSQELLDGVREVTAEVAAAQAEDGYLDSVAQEQDGSLGRRGRYADLTWSHEMYCAGHLFQAAVAVVRATGERALLDVALKLADHLDATFGDGEGQLRDVDGHPVVEMGLVELFRETGERRYLELASWMVEARGTGIIEGHGKDSTYFSDRVRVREATTVEGHAVRAVYLTAGAADVAVETGDAELLAALGRQFDHMLATKTYVTGGLGSRWDMEAFGDPYELPSDRAYAETCAAIGGVQWAWRMLLATGEAKYADVAERMLHNGFPAGVSLGGDEYFYVNPLQVRTGAHADEGRSPAHGRRGWFDCACCPPNIMRTWSSLDSYTAAVDGGEVTVQASTPLRMMFGGQQAQPNQPSRRRAPGCAPVLLVAVADPQRAGVEVFLAASDPAETRCAARAPRASASTGPAGASSIRQAHCRRPMAAHVSAYARTGGARTGHRRPPRPSASPPHRSRTSCRRFTALSQMPARPRPPAPASPPSARARSRAPQGEVEGAHRVALEAGLSRAPARGRRSSVRLLAVSRSMMPVPRASTNRARELEVRARRRFPGTARPGPSSTTGCPSTSCRSGPGPNVVTRWSANRTRDFQQPAVSPVPPGPGPRQPA